MKIKKEYGENIPFSTKVCLKCCINQNLILSIFKKSRQTMHSEHEHVHLPKKQNTQSKHGFR